MVRRLTTGRPGTYAIPIDWAQQHRPVAESTMTGATCEIRGADIIGNFDPDLGRRPVTPGALVYPEAVPCRVVRLDQPQVQSVAEQQVTTFDYLVVVPFLVPGPREGHMITITDADNPDLLAVRLRVQAVVKGSHAWEIDLFAIEAQG